MSHTYSDMLAAATAHERSVLVVSAASDGLVRQRDLARSLGVSDQRIATWRSRSAKNGFPEPVACQIGPHKGGGRRRAYLWRLEDVQAWFRDYDEAAQRSRRGPYWRPERPS